MIPPLQRFVGNPIVRPSQIDFVRASGTFNPGAAIDRASGRVVLLVRVFEEETKRSCLALALSSDGERFEEIRDKPAITREASYEEWGVEDARITYLDADQLYAITYTGYSPAGPRVCLITTDDLLKPERYQRHGPRISGENKNCVPLRASRSSALGPARGEARGLARAHRRSLPKSAGCSPFTARRRSKRATYIQWVGVCSTPPIRKKSSTFPELPPSHPKRLTRSSSSRFLRSTWRTS